jgi:hypothetical protein
LCDIVIVFLNEKIKGMNWDVEGTEEATDNMSRE